MRKLLKSLLNKLNGYLLFAIRYSLFALICSCGFSPMYSDTLTATTKQIYIAPISGTNGIDLRNALTARFGGKNSADTAKYKLDVKLNSPAMIYKGLQKTGDATWQEIRITASYTLKDAATNKILESGTAIASESYTFVSDLVAATASQTNATQNTIRVVADKIAMRVNAKLGTEE
ncbi:MAG: LPS assembly lipoprotein LptE [Rickettsiales bacterium]|jgi:LPS-assembly lipoprotein|nr:LPS assembly lipoprotein LptE [Rickettsiales bacterium]